jgi:RND family efflux transporter MFP subunit
MQSFFMQRSFLRGRVLFAILWVAISLCGCNSDPIPAGAAAATLPSKAAAEPTSQIPPAAADYIASGPLVVENQIDLVAQRDGVVAQVFAEVGAVVTKGQLLAQLDDRQLTADRDAAAAKMRSAEADLQNWEASAKVAQSQRDRAEKLWAANIIAKSEEEKTKYQFEATEFEVERQREDLKETQQTFKSLDLELEKTRIATPFDGVVARRYIRAGQEVIKNDRLFWISAVAPLRVKFALPEAFLGRVRRGTELVVVAVSNPGDLHDARVVLVGPVVDPSSDTIDVTAELQGPVTTLRPGMTANIRLKNPQ